MSPPLPHVEDVLPRLRGARKQSDYWIAFCPGHIDRNNRSLSVREGRHGEARLKCFRGCSRETIIRALGFETNGTVPGGNRRNTTTVPPGLTLAALAHAKRIPVNFLEKIGLCDAKFGGAPVVQVPYRDSCGTAVATRYRCALEGEGRFKWRRGTRAMLYGLESLEDIRRLGWVLFVEGESDRWTACHSNHPNVIGIPGKSTWRPEWAAEFAGLEVYCWQEPEADSLTANLAASFPGLRVFPAPPGVKDLSAAHLAGLDISSLVDRVRVEAMPYATVGKAQAESKVRALRETAGPALGQEDLLELVARDAKAHGYGGDTTALKLAYLCATSRVLRLRHGAIPFHLMLVGPPSSGKTFAATTALSYFPDEAVMRVDASSPRALLYTDEPLRHRVLFFAEKDSIPDDRHDSKEDNPMASAIRHLLQEGSMAYRTVDRGPDNKLVAILRVKEGPTALLTTGIRRAAAQLDSRLFVFDVPDDPEQTRLAITAQAELEERDGEIHTASPQLVAVQSLLQALAPFDVKVRFARVLAQEMTRRGRVLAPRANREFARLVTLVRTAAVLRAGPNYDPADGPIEATIDDYAKIYGLLGRTYEGAGTGATARVRQVVEAVIALKTGGPAYADGVSQTKVLQHLLQRSVQPLQLSLQPSSPPPPQWDKGSVSRTVATALKNGWLINTELRKGFPHQLVPGDDLPTDSGLPTPDELRALMAKGCSVADVSPPTGAAWVNSVAPTAPEPVVNADTLRL